MNTTAVEVQTPGCYVKARLVLVLMMALAGFNVHALRNGINIAILKMVRIDRNDTTLYVSECGNGNENATNMTSDSLHPNAEGEFDWSISQQTLVLASYYYGYAISNLPGALLSKRFGIRFVMGLSGLLSSFLTLLIPTFAKIDFALLISARIIIGLLHGVVYPTMMTALSIWAPPLERSRLLAITYSGHTIGNCVIFPLAGLATTTFGWEAVFYFSGGFALMWSIAWLALVHNSPATHPRISPQERTYIEESIGVQQNTARKIPWLKILTSLPVLAIISAHMSSSFATDGFLTMGPMYIARGQGFDVKSAGFLLSLSFILRVIVLVTWGAIADYLLRKKWFATVTVRKFSSAFSLITASACLLAVGFSRCNTWIALPLLILPIGVLGMGVSGCVASTLDVTSVFSGITHSIANTLNAISAILAPQLSGLLLVDNSMRSWRNVFLLFAGFTLPGAVMFACFASDQVQEWARVPESSEGKEVLALTEKEPEDSQS